MIVYVIIGLLAVLADANFPSASICKHGPEHVRADGKITVHVHVCHPWEPDPLYRMAWEPDCPNIGSFNVSSALPTLR